VNFNPKAYLQRRGTYLQLSCNYRAIIPDENGNVIRRPNGNATKGMLQRGCYKGVATLEITPIAVTVHLVDLLRCIAARPTASPLSKATCLQHNVAKNYKL
jgi:hypothetical protein